MIVEGKQKYLIVNTVGYIPYFSIINVSARGDIITIELEGEKNKISFHFGEYIKLNRTNPIKIEDAIVDIMDNVIK